MTVLHPEFGSGEILTTVDSRTFVDFERHGRVAVDKSELSQAPLMLLHSEIDHGNEWADAESDGEAPLYCGEATIDLQFNDGVDIETDVDVIGFTDHGEDGQFRIKVQYWLEDDLDELENTQ